MKEITEASASVGLLLATVMVYYNVCDSIQVIKYRDFFSKGSQGDSGYRGAEGRAGVKVSNFIHTFFSRERFYMLSFVASSQVNCITKKSNVVKLVLTINQRKRKQGKISTSAFLLISSIMME